jgi:hypothetical protein
MTSFYEDKGMVRHMLILTKPNKERLVEAAKRYGLSQVDFTNVLLEHIDFDSLAPFFNAAATTGRGRKVTPGGIAKKLKGLTPEKLAEIEKLIEAQ